MTPQTTTYLTVKETANLLKVHEETIYRLLGRKAIPAFKVMGSWRFIKDDLLDWARGQYHNAAGMASCEKKERICHTEEQGVGIGGSSSMEYASLLGLKSTKTQRHLKHA